MTPAPLQFGQAPSELALNRAGFTPFALANALRIGSSSPVYVAGLLRREPLDRALVDRHDALPARDRAVDQRALARPGHAGHAPRARRAGCRRRRPAGCSVLAPRTSSAPVGVRTDRLQRRAVVEVSPGQRVARPQPLDRALEHDLAAVGAGARARGRRRGRRSRSTSGLCSTTSTVLPLSRSCSSRLVHPLDVVRMQPDRGLVEDVRDVGQRRPEVADHLGALRLAARQRARRPIEREVAEPDLDERVERVLQAGEQRRDRRLVEAAQPRRPGR